MVIVANTEWRMDYGEAWQPGNRRLDYGSLQTGNRRVDYE